MSSIRNREPIRFVAVSATIPNVCDVAEWLEQPGRPCAHHSFGEEKRPVPLRRVVLGYPGKMSSDGKSLDSPFLFERNLSYRVAGVISTYSEVRLKKNFVELMTNKVDVFVYNVPDFLQGLPTLVFVNTRVSAMSTASQLVIDLKHFLVSKLTYTTKSALSEVASRITTFSNDHQKLRESVGHGIGFHHAGLDHQVKGYTIGLVNPQNMFANCNFFL